MLSNNNHDFSVFRYYIHIVWEHTIIMDNQNPFYFQ
jgi:hypothetical protein